MHSGGQAENVDSILDDDDDDEEKEEEKDQEEEEVCSWGSNPFPNEILQGSHSNPILVS